MTEEITGALRDCFLDVGVENAVTALNAIAKAIEGSFTTGEFTSAGNITEALILIAHHLGRIADHLEK